MTHTRGTVRRWLEFLLAGVERVGGLQCFKKAQQEIYDEFDCDLKQVRPLAVGEVAIHGSCLDTLCCGERFQAGRSWICYGHAADQV